MMCRAWRKERVVWLYKKVDSLQADERQVRLDEVM